MEKETNFSTGLAKPWIELNNLCWNLMYEKTLGQLVQIPLVGPNRGFHQQLMQAFNAWANLYPVGINYQLVLAEIQLQSLEELMRSLNSLSEKGELLKDWSQFQQLWSRTVDEVYEQTFCAEDNLRIRGKALNAMNHYKLCQQELMEMGLKTLNLPLRSEVDEIHQSIYELKKEVKSLKKSFKTESFNTVRDGYL